MKCKIIVLVALLWQLKIFALDITTKKVTSDITVQVNSVSGTIVQFPEPVISVTTAKNYRIEPTRGTQNPASGSVADVAEFLVTPLVANAKPEEVSFIVFSLGSYNVKFTTSPNGDKFYQVKTLPQALAQKPKTNTKSIPIDSFFSNFLSPETKLMKAMISDNGDLYAKMGMYKKFVFAPYSKDVDIYLVRVFQGPSNLMGYTFIFKNNSRSELKVFPQSLSIGVPNQAVMVQTDREVLPSCGKARNECSTAVRYIIKNSSNSGGSGNMNFQLLDSGMPFTVSSATSG